MKKVILFIILLFLVFFCVNAKTSTTYNKSIYYANSAMDSYDDYNYYIVSVSNNEFSSSGIPFQYRDNDLSTNSDFMNAGYLNEYEYVISGGKESYLNTGDAFFTMTKLMLIL